MQNGGIGLLVVLCSNLSTLHSSKFRNSSLVRIKTPNTTQRIDLDMIPTLLRIILVPPVQDGALLLKQVSKWSSLTLTFVAMKAHIYLASGASK